MLTDALPFGDLIKDEERSRFLSQSHCQRKRIYTPDVTLSAFLSQVVDQSGSCQTAVNGLHLRPAPSINPASSLNTSSYSRARKRLQTDAIKELTRTVGKSAKNSTQEDWLWKGRKVCILDGSTVAMADTPENVARYPKRRNQKVHSGFPLARVMLTSTLETGTVLDFCMAPYKGKGTGEIPLGTKLLDSIESNSVLLADAMFVSYSFMSLCKDRNLDFLAPKKSNRKYRIVREKKLGPGDKIVCFRKPRCPHTGWIDAQDHDRLPETITLRETQITIRRNGFRTRNITILSTFIDADKYSVEDLAKLFLSRWNIELDLRIIKRELGMNFLSCKTPEMVEKEIWVNLLAFNLIRRFLGIVARKIDVPPRRLSFKNTLDYYLKVLSRRSFDPFTKMPAALVDAVSSFQIRKQPDRFEPRARKTQYSHSDFPSLTMTREQWRLIQLMPFLMAEIDFSSAVLDGFTRLKAKIPIHQGKSSY
jgi:hypothetical protein